MYIIHGPREKLWHIKTAFQRGWVMSPHHVNKWPCLFVIYNFMKHLSAGVSMPDIWQAGRDLANILEIAVFFCNVVSILAGICHMHHMWYRSLLW